MFVKYKELLLKPKKKNKTNKKKNLNYQAYLKGEILFWMFPKIKDELSDTLFMCATSFTSLSSTQFSSDQIQNGGVNSDG